MAVDNISAYNSRKTHEERSETARRAGLASGEAKRERKTLSDIVCAWGEGEIKDRDMKKQLEALGVKDLTNKSMLILSLLKNVNERGDTKSIQMLTELLRQDSRREVEIEKMRLENEMLKRQLNGDTTDFKITIVNDIPAPVDEEV